MSLLSKDLSQTALDTWFSSAELVDLDNNNAVICAANDLAKQVISERFSARIKNALNELFCADYNIIVISGREGKEKYNAQKEGREGSRPSAIPAYRFEDYIIGETNRFAYMAARAAAKRPGDRKFNPLYIHGPSGIGKTHLLSSAGIDIHNYYPGKRVLYIKGEEFTNRLVKAVKSGRTEQFHEEMRNVDVLLVDGVDFIAGKQATQEEFFNTFNELYSNGKQIVISSDRPPDAIEKLEERMRSRFKSGIVVAIDKPDTETRMAILRSKAQTLGVKIDDEALFLIADKVDTNIRELEGTLNNANLMAKVSGQSTVTYDIACKCVLNYAIKKADEAAVTPELIIGEVARRYGITEEDILSAKRSREIAVPRQLAIYLTRELCGFSTPKIGSVFGRDHSTVMHACKKTEEMIRESAEFSSVFRQIVASVKGE